MNDDEHRAGAKSAAVDRCYRAPGLTNWVQPHPGAGRSGRLSVCTRGMLAERTEVRRAFATAPC